MNKTVKDRTIEFVKYKGITMKSFEIKCGLSTGYVTSMRKGFGSDKLNNVLTAFPELNRDWLLYGEGSMLRSDAYSGSQQVSYPVPVIYADSVGGMDSTNAITGEPQYVERLVSFPGAHEGDVAVVQSGDSMIPTIPPGALIHIRRVQDWREFFGYGNIFVLVLKDGRRITKEVHRADTPDHVLSVSHNPDVAPEPLPKDFIADVWKVLNVLTSKGW